MKKKSCDCRDQGLRISLKHVKGEWRCESCDIVYVKLKSLGFECKKDECTNLYYDSREQTMTCHSCGKIKEVETKKEVDSVCEDMAMECLPSWDNFHKIMKCQVCGDIFVPKKYRPKKITLF